MICLPIIISQTKKGLYDARFQIADQTDNTIGQVQFLGNPFSMGGIANGKYDGQTFSLYPEKGWPDAKRSHPYTVLLNSIPCGIVYGEPEGPWWRRQYLPRMEVYGTSYITKQKYGHTDIYLENSNVNVARIKKLGYSFNAKHSFNLSKINNDLHSYSIAVQEEADNLVSILFCLYSWITTAYVPGQQIEKSISVKASNVPSSKE